jgi:hypothetical protein
MRGTRSRNFLGVLYHQAVQEASAGPDEERGRISGGAVSRNSLYALAGLYRRRSVSFADGKRVEERSVLPLAHSRTETEPSGRGFRYVKRRVKVLPFGWLLSLESDNYGSGVLDAHFLYPLGRYFRGERLSGDGRREFAKTFSLLPLWSYERTWLPPADDAGARPRLRAGTLKATPAARGRVRAGALGREESVRFRLLQILFGYERETSTDRARAFVLGGAPEDVRGEKHAIALWSRERGPSTDYRHGLLWRAITAERSGGARLASDRGPGGPSETWEGLKWYFSGSPRKFVRVGPLASYGSDWRTDSRRFTLFLGLFSYVRTGRLRGGRILWFIPWGHPEAGRTREHGLADGGGTPSAPAGPRR